MKITLRLDKGLLDEARALAAASGRTLDEFTADALVEVLARRRAAAKREPIVLVTAGGDGLMPGVDINNSAALLDILEPPEEIRARLGIRDDASRPSEPNQS
jgi:hypothetical protein